VIRDQWKFYSPESGNHESGVRKFLLVMDVSVARRVSVVCVFV
jgi:hypothetical protein